MTVDGSWQVVITSPRGAQEGTLVLATEGGKLTGKLELQMGIFELTDGAVDGQSVTWEARPDPQGIRVRPSRPVTAKDGAETEPSGGSAESDGDGPSPTAEELAADPMRFQFTGSLDGETLQGNGAFRWAGRQVETTLSGSRAS